MVSPEPVSDDGCSDFRVYQDLHLTDAAFRGVFPVRAGAI